VRLNRRTRALKKDVADSEENDLPLQRDRKSWRGEEQWQAADGVAASRGDGKSRLLLVRWCHRVCDRQDMAATLAARYAHANSLYLRKGGMQRRGGGVARHIAGGRCWRNGVRRAQPVRTLKTRRAYELHEYLKRVVHSAMEVGWLRGQNIARWQAKAGCLK